MEQAKRGLALESRGDRTAVGRSDMDFRDYGIGAQILVALGLRKIRLLYSTLRNVVALDGYNLEIVEQVALN